MIENVSRVTNVRSSGWEKDSRGVGKMEWCEVDERPYVFEVNVWEGFSRKWGEFRRRGKRIV